MQASVVGSVAASLAREASFGEVPDLVLLNDVWKSYDGVPVLEGLFLEVPCGTVSVVLGGSGSGSFLCGLGGSSGGRHVPAGDEDVGPAVRIHVGETATGRFHARHARFTGHVPEEGGGSLPPVEDGREGQDEKGEGPNESHSLNPSPR